MGFNIRERVSDTDRKQAIETVHAAAIGLDHDEYDRRLNAAMEARTTGEIDAATRNLPKPELVTSADEKEGQAYREAVRMKVRQLVGDGRLTEDERTEVMESIADCSTIKTMRSRLDADYRLIVPTKHDRLVHNVARMAWVVPLSLAVLNLPLGLVLAFAGIMDPAWINAFLPVITFGLLLSAGVLGIGYDDSHGQPMRVGIPIFAVSVMFYGVMALTSTFSWTHGGDKAPVWQVIVAGVVATIWAIIWHINGRAFDALDSTANHEKWT